MVFHWSPSDNKSPQEVTRTLLSILADFNSAVVLIGSIVSLISMFIGTITRVSVTTGMTVYFIFHNSFQFSVKISLFVQLFASFSFSLWKVKVHKITTFFLVK